MEREREGSRARAEILANGPMISARSSHSSCLYCLHNILFRLNPPCNDLQPYGDDDWGRSRVQTLNTSLNILMTDFITCWMLETPSFFRGCYGNTAPPPPHTPLCFISFPFFLKKKKLNRCRVYDPRPKVSFFPWTFKSRLVWESKIVIVTLIRKPLITLLKYWLKKDVFCSQIFLRTCVTDEDKE